MRHLRRFVLSLTGLEPWCILLFRLSWNRYTRVGLAGHPHLPTPLQPVRPLCPIDESGSRPGRRRPREYIT